MLRCYHSKVKLFLKKNPEKIRARCFEHEEIEKKKFPEQERVKPEL